MLDKLDAKYLVSVVIHGAARGADALSDAWARARGKTVLAFPAEWEKHEKKAGILRNIEMLDRGAPDCAVAFPGGRGTAHMVGLARARSVRVWDVSSPV